MTKLPSTRPVRLAQQICRIAGVAYLMIGLAVIGILVGAPMLSGKMGSEQLFAIKDGVLTSTTLWWDGIINPIFHGTVFFVLAGALGYLADLAEALMDRDDDAADAIDAADAAAFVAEEAASRRPKPIEIGDDIPALTEDDLQPQG